VISEPNPTLARLAYNLRWAWHTPTANLFRSVAPDVWDNTTNPLAVVKAIKQSPTVLAARANLLAGLGAALDEYLSLQNLTQPTPRVAYFSAEFAIAECLPLYSGGLGVLAGDHLKAACDLGGAHDCYRSTIPIRLFPPDDRCRRSTAGHLRSARPESIPLQPVLTADGVPVEIGVPYPGRTVVARAWLARVGRVPRYLLDTDVPRIAKTTAGSRATCWTMRRPAPRRAAKSRWLRPVRPWWRSNTTRKDSVDREESMGARAGRLSLVYQPFAS
jgi:glycogen phosphorylase